MKTLFRIAIQATIVLLVLSSCQKARRIMPDKDYYLGVKAAFEERKALAASRSDELFGVFEGSLNKDEKDALMFLYAYMPLSDLADYDGEYHLKMVRSSLEARKHFSWGQSVPTDLFRHFVLPYRINNENLDTARLVFFEELKSRIAGLDMLDAALEVNHWCHEKVTYRSTDIRTSAPLATVKSAFGRCGEESTFTVAALRAVSIPARQVYTPRWAHTNDNHAWVEFWANGTWYYMGACEPEAVPDKGWFTEPARRAMLVHTKAFGKYRGDEYVENQMPHYALLNTLETYAPVKTIQVKVSDNEGKAVQGAKVEFRLFNYAEFYPIATKSTNENGLASLKTGLGDLMVWASHQGLADFKIISVGATDTLSLILGNPERFSGRMEFDIYPPVERTPLPVDQSKQDENRRRLMVEDSIRAAYEMTFMPEDEAVKLAGQLSLDPETVWSLINQSRGNYTEISTFLKSVKPDERYHAVELLLHLAQKDLRDTRADILLDHLRGFLKSPRPIIEPDPHFFSAYVLNPRVAFEMLVAYREPLSRMLGDSLLHEFRMNPQSILGFVRENIRFDPVSNYYHTPLTPVGVLKLKVSDDESLRVFMVSVLRTAGVPARLEPGTLDAQYYTNESGWTSLRFDKIDNQTEKALLSISSNSDNPFEPLYYNHFSLAGLTNGLMHTLDYDYDRPASLFEAPLFLDPGFYALITGNRQPGGSVLATIDFFQLNEGTSTQVDVKLKSMATPSQSLGVIQTGWDMNPVRNTQPDWADFESEPYCVIAWIDPGKEPTKHALKDLSDLRHEFEKAMIPVLLLVPSDRYSAQQDPGFGFEMPVNLGFATVNGYESLEQVEKTSGRDLKDHLPVFIVLKNQKDLVYLSSGYKIGIGEELLRLISASL